MKITRIDWFGGDVILTEGMVDGSTGRPFYSVFATEEDARSPEAESLAPGMAGKSVLTPEQIATASANRESLAEQNGHR